MNFLKRFFSSQKPAANTTDSPVNLIDIAKKIEPIIENTVRDIFHTNHIRLLSEDITYIVFAVWGARNDGELTDEQKKINEEVNPVIDRIMELINLDSINPQQDYTLRYLIRSLIISKTIFLTELANKRLCELREHSNHNNDPVLPKDFFEGFFDQDNERWKQWFGGDRGRRW